MIPVTLDVSDIVAEFAMSQAQNDQFKEFVVKRLASRFYETWLQIAGQELHGSRAAYQRSIILVDRGRFRKAVMLVNKFPNMLEQGASAFDMKNGFSLSSKKKISKSGKWYLHIPFRFATPGALGESEVFTDILPRRVYSLLRKKESLRTAMGGQSRRRATLSLSELPEEYQKKGFREEVANADRVFARYIHKTSIYQNIGRSVKTYENATQGQYVSFRTVGEASDPNAWIHQGLVARNLADKALQRLDIEFESQVAIDNFLSS